MPRLAPVALLGALLTAGCSVFGGRAAPEPDYTVLHADPPFEIREYPELTVARTTAEGDRDRAVSRGFGRLFDYISGDNEGAQDIAMTAPVTSEPASEEIAMTAPVLTEDEAGGWQVSFILPEGMTAETAPRPTDPEVEIATLPARTVAAVTFSGFLGEEKIAAQRRRLADWLESRPEEISGDWQVAGYNPPWTLPWFRRNEVLVPVAAPD